jgi:predicted DNA-binding transcriptional regulator AlpA
MFRVKMRKQEQSTVALTRSADEARQILGVSRATFYRMVNLGEIRPIAHNGVLRFSQKEIDRYLGPRWRWQLEIPRPPAGEDSRRIHLPPQPRHTTVAAGYKRLPSVARD